MKILVIRFKFIGDVLLSSTLCSSLRASFPDAQIDFLMHENAAQLFKDNPAIDNILTLSPKERKTIAYLRKIWKVSRSDYDIIIDASSTAKTELISMLSPRAKYRIGRQKRGRGYFYTHKIAKQFVNKVDQRMAMLKPLNDDNMKITEDRNMKIYPSESEIKLLHSRLSESGVDTSKKVFAFSVSSKFDYRYWNLDRMQEVVEHCLNHHSAEVVLLPGMAHEQELINDFRNRFAEHARIFSSVNAQSLRELFALLSLCDIYVGNEGGPRHFAEAVGLPTVCIFSPSADLEEWLPATNSRHQAVEWRTILPQGYGEYESGDETYLRLYDLIKPDHVIPLVDDVVAKNL